MYSRAVTHPSTNQALRCLTSVIRDGTVIYINVRAILYRWIRYEGAGSK